MNADQSLTRNVLDELQWDPALAGCRIDAVVHGGIATLSGHVHSHAQRWRATAAALRVRGVGGAISNLHVDLPVTARLADDRIADAARRVLGWNVLIPPDCVNVTVEDARVTLSGTVEWDYQRRAAEAALRDMIGLKDLLNLIEIKPQIEPRAVTGTAKAALGRRIQRHAKHVSVVVDGGTVTLCGQLDSWSERHAARLTAWAAPGVRSVVDHTTIAA